MIARDAKVDVFVKEVWKNSGRYTLTLDPTVSKTRLVEAKEKTKKEGLARRRARFRSL